MENRQDFYNKIPGFWHDLYNSEYALFDAKQEKQETIDQIRTASGRIARIFYKTSSLLRQLDNETLLQLGYPAATVPYLRFKDISFESIIARLDLVVTEHEIKLLEFNSDTPTFIKECFYVNDYVCRHWQLPNPNAGLEKQLAVGIREAVEQSLDSLVYRPNDKVVFTSHNDHEEDYLTTKYLLKISGLDAEYIPLHELKLVNEDVLLNDEIVVHRGLYTPDNERIDVLYRQTYPLEYLINDKDSASGASVGELLLQLVLDRQLAIINPPSSFLLQSKAIMSLIWGLHEEKHPFYSEEEHGWIRQYFLPTYLDEEPLRNSRKAYVKKPSFGREGDSVSIYQADGTLMHEDAHKNFASELAVYQQYIDLPQIDIRTEQGIERASIMYGSFIINGKPSAIGIRAGSQITNNASYYLPVAICKQGENYNG